MKEVFKLYFLGKKDIAIDYIKQGYTESFSEFVSSMLKNIPNKFDYTDKEAEQLAEILVNRLDSRILTSYEEDEWEGNLIFKDINDIKKLLS